MFYYVFIIFHMFFLMAFSCVFMFFLICLFLPLRTPQELHDLWLEASKEPVWQQIFSNCGILDELDDDAIEWLNKRHKPEVAKMANGKMEKMEKMKKAPEEKAPQQKAPAFESPEKVSTLPRRLQGSRGVDWLTSKEAAPTLLAKAKSKAKSSKPVVTLPERLPSQSGPKKSTDDMEMESGDEFAKDFLVKLGWLGNIKARNRKPKQVVTKWIQFLFWGKALILYNKQRFTKVGHVHFVSFCFLTMTAIQQ